MPFLEHRDAKIYYEIHGEGFPILLLAPGGMRSSIPFWDKVPWNPVTQLSGHYQVIAMDQRNAGQSSGPIDASDNWQTFADDQIALLDHLNVERCHLAGMCIGGPYIMGLIQACPERIASGVVFQTIGLDNNRDAFFEMFDSWAVELQGEFPSMDQQSWISFRHNMFGGDFLFNVSEEFVQQCQTPLLVLMGKDIYHPEVSSRRLAELAPAATFVEHWKEPEHIAAAKRSVESFLAQHTP